MEMVKWLVGWLTYLFPIFFIIFLLYYVLVIRKKTMKKYYTTIDNNLEQNKQIIALLKEIRELLKK